MDNILSCFEILLPTELFSPISCVNRCLELKAVPLFSLLPHMEAKPIRELRVPSRRAVLYTLWSANLLPLSSQGPAPLYWPRLPHGLTSRKCQNAPCDWVCGLTELTLVTKLSLCPFLLFARFQVDCPGCHFLLLGHTKLPCPPEKQDKESYELVQIFPDCGPERHTQNHTSYSVFSLPFFFQVCSWKAQAFLILSLLSLAPLSLEW